MTLKRPKKVPDVFANLTAALPWIRDDAVIRLMTTEELFTKYSPKIIHPIKRGSFEVRLTNEGIVAARRAVKKSLGDTIKRGKERLKQRVTTKTKQLVIAKAEKAAGSVSNIEIAEKLASAILDSKLKAAKIHEARVARQLDRIHGAIKLLPDDSMAGPDSIAAVDKYHKMGRLLFGMDDSKPLNSQQFNIAVLLNSGQVPVDLAQSTDDEDEVIDL